MKKHMTVHQISKGRKLFFAGAFGILISFFYVAGKPLDVVENLDLLNKRFYLCWGAGSLAATGIVWILWEITDKMKKCKVSFPSARFPLKHWMVMAILILCWIPAWMSLFPGAFNYDAIVEWQQVRDHTITAHHPVIHVFWLGGLVEGLHGITGSYNAGIAVYTFMQMFILANVLARTIHFLKEFTLPDSFRWFALCFYGLSPVVQLFAISATKDVMFTAALVMFMVGTIRFSSRKVIFFNNRRQMLSFGVATFFTMIMRNNGFYIILITLAVMLFYSKRYWKKLAIILAGIGIAYGIYSVLIYGILNVKPGGIEEMLSVPIQQIARVYNNEKESLEQPELDLLFEVIPEDKWSAYCATVSDYVKSGFKREVFDEHKLDYLKLWWKIGIEHPLIYINSFLINTVDFWYPHAVVNGYRSGSFFDYQVLVPGMEVVLLPMVHDYYEAISADEAIQKKPFVFLFLSPGWYLVLTMLIFGYFWRSRIYEFMLSGVAFVVLMLTVLLGPIALVRYVLILYFAFPMFLPFMFKRSEQAELSI